MATRAMPLRRRSTTTSRRTDDFDLNPAISGGPNLLNKAQVAVHLGRCPRAIRNWVRAGDLRPVRIGGAVFFREEDVEHLAKFRSIGGSATEL